VHIAERYGYSIFDSLIIAAALHAGASTLYTEDMRDGQAIDGLTIRNPFSRETYRSRPPACDNFIIVRLARFGGRHRPPPPQFLREP
jgi:hypothetical protein